MNECGRKSMYDRYRFDRSRQNSMRSKSNMASLDHVMSRV